MPVIVTDIVPLLHCLHPPCKIWLRIETAIFDCPCRCSMFDSMKASTVDFYSQSPQRAAHRRLPCPGCTTHPVQPATVEPSWSNHRPSHIGSTAPRLHGPTPLQSPVHEPVSQVAPGLVVAGGLSATGCLLLLYLCLCICRRMATLLQSRLSCSSTASETSLLPSLRTPPSLSPQTSIPIGLSPGILRLSIPLSGPRSCAVPPHPSVALTSAAALPPFFDSSLLQFSTFTSAVRRSLALRAQSADSDGLTDAPHPSTKVLAPLVQYATALGQQLHAVLEESPDRLPEVTQDRLAQLRAEQQQVQAAMASASAEEAVLYERVLESMRQEHARALRDVICCDVAGAFHRHGVRPLQATDVGLGFDRTLLGDGLSATALSPQARAEVRGIVEGKLAPQGGIFRVSHRDVADEFSKCTQIGYFMRRADESYGLRAECGLAIDEAGREMSFATYLERLPPEVSAEFIRPASQEAKATIGDYCSSVFGGVSKRQVELEAAMQEHGLTETEAVQQYRVDSLVLSTASLRRVLLQAVAFGALIWEAESRLTGTGLLTQNC